MGTSFRFGGKVAVLALMIALLGGCGTVISAARSVIAGGDDD